MYTSSLISMDILREIAMERATYMKFSVRIGETWSSWISYVLTPFVLQESDLDRLFVAPPAIVFGDEERPTVNNDNNTYIWTLQILAVYFLEHIVFLFS